MDKFPYFRKSSTTGKSGGKYICGHPCASKKIIFSFFVRVVVLGKDILKMGFKNSREIQAKSICV